jgi:metal-responsive CopG/Arc/MetJ family transcriptional regulator
MAEKARYVNVSVPDKLAKAIDEYIKDNPKLDLRSRAQVVNFALRKLFTDIKD